MFGLRTQKSAALCVSVALGILAADSTALACACCDGGSSREIVGWSDSGRSALVRFETQACDQVVALEIWRSGAAAPVGCFDLLSDQPDERIECSAVSDGMHEVSARSGTRVRHYPVPPERMHDRFVRARAWRVDTAEDEPDYASPAQLRVEVRTPSGWQFIYEGRFSLGRPESYDGPVALQYLPMPLEVSVWPNPSGDHALVAISGHNSAPGMGRFPTDLVWAELPADAPTLRGSTTDEPTLAVFEHRRGVLRQVRAARSVVRIADRDAAERRYSAAAYHYATALVGDPRNAKALIGLAAMQIQLGRPESALDLLASAVQLDPESIVVLQNADAFGVLHGVPAFWVLIDAAGTMAANQAAD